MHLKQVKYEFNAFLNVYNDFFDRNNKKLIFWKSSNFIDFKGHSILFVGLYNPKGPCEEVQVKHTGKNTFTVNYYIRERGEYTLLVMWGESHIPGSPFAVEVPTK